MYPSTGSDAEYIPESNAHVTFPLESFATSPISNAVCHVLRTAPCISCDNGDDGTHQAARGLPASTAVHHVSRFEMVTASVAVKSRRADRWP